MREWTSALLVAPILLLVAVVFLTGCNGIALTPQWARDLLGDSDGDDRYICRDDNDRATIFTNEDSACDCEGDNPEQLGVSYLRLYADEDSDGFGDSTLGTQPYYGCEESLEFVEKPGDCDDGDAGVSPDVSETCDNDTDDDCDGIVDEFNPLTFYLDGDGDGFGAGAPILVCQEPDCDNTTSDCYVDNSKDCDDEDDQVNPNQNELLGNTIDEDCDGILLCHQDSDNDSFPAAEPTSVQIEESDLCITDAEVDLQNIDCDDNCPFGDKREETRINVEPDADCDCKIDEGESCLEAVELSLKSEDGVEDLNGYEWYTFDFQLNYPSEPEHRNGPSVCGPYATHSNDGDLTFRLSNLPDGPVQFEVTRAATGVRPDGHECVGDIAIPALWVHAGCPLEEPGEPDVSDSVLCLAQSTPLDDDATSSLTLDPSELPEGDIYLVLTALLSGDPDRGCFRLSWTIPPTSLR